jgi:hypothetical protein
MCVDFVKINGDNPFAKEAKVVGESGEANEKP